MRSSLLAVAIITAGVAEARAADPEFKPDGPVKIVVGCQPGGIGDTVARPVL
jgi:tripartite-type tricarboxylate transporter receptor subunit TctC